MQSITGVNEQVLEKPLPKFEEVYEEKEQARYMSQVVSGKRQRQRGGGRKSKLGTMREKLVYILYYLKTYPSLDVLGSQFDLSRSNAHGQVQKLLPILQGNRIKIESQSCEQKHCP